MIICKDHWSRMREKVRLVGLEHLVSPTSEEVARRTAADIQAHEQGADPDPKDFDPLMSMWWAFNSKALEMYGIDSMSPEFGCILCHLKAVYDHHNTATGKCGDPQCTITVAPGALPFDEEWIQGCGDVQFDAAKELGLIQRSS